MTVEDFVEEYISNCINSGVCSPKDICAQAYNRIKEIDVEIVKFNQLRREKINLESVLRSFNSDDPKKSKFKKLPMVSNQNVDLDPTYKDILVAICNFIEINKSVMPRDIMDSIVIGQKINSDNIEDKHKMIYMSIKWLLDNGIINRNDSDRSIFPGEKWEDRPINT